MCSILATKHKNGFQVHFGMRERLQLLLPTGKKEPEQAMAEVEQGKDGESAAKLILTRTKVRTSDPSDGLDIARELSGLASDEPLTVGAMMQQTVSRVPDRAALCYKDEKAWNSITYQQYYSLCIAAAKSFIRVRKG